MIVEMSQVIVLGPKRLLGQVIDEVQQLGALHIDRIESDEGSAVSRMQLGDAETQTLQALERVLSRVDGLLTLLPPLPVQAGPPPSDGTVDVLEAEVAELERKVKDLTRRRLELEEERTLIASYEGAVRVLSPLLAALSGSKAVESIGFLLSARDLTAAAAVRNELMKATDGRVEVLSRVVDENRIGIVVAFLRHDGERVRAVLSRAGVAELRLPARFAQDQPTETIATMERRKAELPAELDRLDRELASINAATRSRLLALRAWFADQLAQLKVVPELAQSKYTVILYGWAPTHTVDEIRGLLRARFGSDVMVVDEPVNPHEEVERVPVLLDNHPLIRPFQRLLALFRPPRYGTWDPSPVMAITFPIFVGLVIGDVGYGVLLFWLGWVFRKKAKAQQALELRLLNLRFPPPLLMDISFLLRVTAIWIITFGVIYGEAFGNVPELVFHVQPLFNRVEDTTRYFLFIIAAGIFMIFLGLLVHLTLAIRHRHTVGVFESFVIMLGTAGLLLFLGARGAMLPAGWAVIGLYFFLAAVVVAAVSLVVERDVIKRVLWLLESTAAFGHILSHARLMAFGLAAAALATAANQLGAQAGGLGVVGIIVSILVAAFFQSLFILFTILGHVIQPARLHWVEFFTKFKFHEESGRPYQPFHKAAAPGRQ
jgi:V/A-type H+-transporting ATPase subunit I